MTASLSFRDARHPEDRADLDHFVCTAQPSKSAATGWKLRHPRMWEYEVQQAMRGTVIPSLQSDRFMRLGLDGEGLATVVLWEELEGPGRVLVHAAAVALRAQGRGYGNAMLTDALDEMTGRAVNAGLPTLTVGARVFHQNSASQAMCRRAQGAPTGESYPTGADEWGLVLLLT